MDAGETLADAHVADAGSLEPDASAPSVPGCSGTTYRKTLSVDPVLLRPLSPFRSSVSRVPLPRVQRSLRSPHG